MSPYKMAYGKACQLPLKLEHKAYWAIKELNYDFKLAGEKCWGYYYQLRPAQEGPG